jgi:trans-aconitate 2-methyltransferase
VSSPRDAAETSRGAAETSRDWDATSYHRVSDPQFGWALEQLERLPLVGDEVLLDAGCGSGRVTAELVARVPRGRVYGVDVAPSMAAHAQAALEGKATILCQDLVELELPEPVDAVFSNATFHWISDHAALFGALRRVLKPGGRLVAQCGGHGNIDRFRRLADEVAREEPFAALFDGWRGPWNYATAEDTEQRLRAAGFIDIACWLEPKRVVPGDPRAFVQTVCLVRHLDRVPPGAQGAFVDRVLERAEDPLVLEYVRLNMTGVAGEGGQPQGRTRSGDGVGV